MTLSEIQAAADTAFFKYKEAKRIADAVYFNACQAAAVSAYSDSRKIYTDYLAARDAADVAYAVASKNAAQAAFELSRAKRRQTANV